MKNFEDYRKEYFATVRKAEGRIDLEGPMRLPEAFALRLMWGYESGAVAVPNDPDGRAVRILYAKLTNELLAFVGSVRVGSLHGAWHHIRAIIEVRAAVHYLWLAEPSERELRIERYLTYLDALGWLRRQQVQNAGDVKRAKMLDDAARRAGRVYTQSDIDGWSKLFKVDVQKRPQDAKWHPGISISKMVSECDASGGAMADYWAYSHATHASPLGGRLGSETLRLVGFDWTALPGAVDSAMGHSHFSAVALDAAHGMGLRSLVRAEMDEFLRIRGKSMTGV